MKTALVIRHVEHEGLAGYRAPLERAGYAIERVYACEADLTARDMISADLLVVLGGPMGAYETDRHPWLIHEVAAIARRLAADRPTLGVCLGAQLVAAALGAAVYPGSVREVGFAPLSLTVAGRASPLRHLAGIDVLHWHGDTFDLPAGTERLASTPAYANQAFRRGDTVLALQCHAEMGEDARIEAWLADHGYIAGAGTDAATLRATHDRLGAAAVRAGETMLAKWLDVLEARSSLRAPGRVGGDHRSTPGHWR